MKYAVREFILNREVGSFRRATSRSLIVERASVTIDGIGILSFKGEDEP